MRFADYDAGGRQARWGDVTVRAMTIDDTRAVADLIAEREGIPVAQLVEGVATWPGAHDQLTLVAVQGGVIRGYGRAARMDPAAAGGRGPRGWYLCGLVVAPAARRHGIGSLLTTERIRLLAQRTDRIWYFANLENRATLALHERHGFIEHTRDFEIPGVTFTGGRGALFGLTTGLHSAGRGPCP